MKDLVIDVVVVALSFLDFKSVIQCGAVSRKFRGVLMDSRFFKILLAHHLPTFRRCSTGPFGGPSYGELVSARNYYVQLLRELRRGDCGLTSACRLIEEHLNDSASCLRPDIFLELLLLDRHPSIDESLFLKAVFLCQDGDLPILLPKLISSNIWGFEERASKALGMAKRRLREVAWESMCNDSLPGDGTDSRLPVSQEEDSFYLSTGIHEISAGMHFVSRLVIGCYDQDFVESTLDAVASLVWAELCPPTLQKEEDKRVFISKINRFKVVSVLGRLLFHPRPIDPTSSSDVPNDGFLGIRPAGELSYYHWNSSVLDRVLRLRCGIPLSLCSLFCMAGTRCGLQGIHLLNLARHVQVGLRIRIGGAVPLDVPLNEPLNHRIMNITTRVGIHNRLEMIQALDIDCGILIDCFNYATVGMVDPSPRNITTMRASHPMSLVIRALNNISGSCARFIDVHNEHIIEDISIRRQVLEAQLIELQLIDSIFVYTSVLRNRKPDMATLSSQCIKLMQAATDLGLICLAENAFKSFASRCTLLFLKRDSPLSDLTQQLSQIINTKDPPLPAPEMEVVQEFLRCISLHQIEQRGIGSLHL